MFFLHFQCRSFSYRYLKSKYACDIGQAKGNILWKLETTGSQINVSLQKWEIFRPGQKCGCLKYRRNRRFFSPTFINPSFQFSSTVQYEHLDHKKSKISKHPSFQYSPIMNIKNLDFKNLRFPNIRLLHPSVTPHEIIFTVGDFLYI